MAKADIFKVGGAKTGKKAAKKKTAKKAKPKTAKGKKDNLSFSRLGRDDLLAAAVPGGEAPLDVVRNYCEALWQWDRHAVKETKLIRFKIGKALAARKKTEVGRHGNWQSYITDNFPFCYKTARRFVLFAERATKADLASDDKFSVVCVKHNILDEYRQDKKDKPPKDPKSDTKSQRITIRQFEAKVTVLGKQIEVLLLQTPKMKDSFYSPVETAGVLQQAKEDIAGYIQSLRDLTKQIDTIEKDVTTLKANAA